MENYTYEGNNQRRIEIFILIIHSIYCLGMCESFLISRISNGTEFFILLLLALNWIICVSKCKTYLFRVKFSAMMMQGCMVLYATQAEEPSRILSAFLVFVVILGLYGNAKIIYITAVSILMIYAYHIFVLQSIPVDSVKSVAKILSQIGNVYILEYIVYLWTKRNYEGSKQLLDTIEESKVAERSKNDFLANVSHEIRTPLNTICGMSELLMGEELPHKIRASVQNIDRAGRNLMAVVSDILDYSELQSGKIEVQEEAYNITSTLNDVINMSLAQKKEKKIELIVDCDATIPCALLGDEKKIRRVIMNLVDNAIKFTNEGYVSINIGYRREAYGINLVVAVKDSGIGMDEESLEKLFVEFNQVDSRRNRQEGGVGLGLAISHVLVRKMGGAITVRSKSGKGSVVQFTIPQKVLDETPIATIENRENVNVATYIDMEQFDMLAIRDEYSQCILHMVEQLKGRCHICRNFNELMHREKVEQFSHIFISIVEYRADKEYFDELAQRTKVVVVLNREDEKDITNPQVLKIYKPFYILTIVSVLNGHYDTNQEGFAVKENKFVTKNASVLVVDDNRMNIRVIEGLLEDYGVKVSIAGGGREALEKIADQKYDFIFMDHMMPEMDGVETLHRIRHKVGTYYQKVPVVALTANAVAGAREMLLAEGFSDFLEKPVERSVLERVLKRNLPEEKIIFKSSIRKEEYGNLSDERTETENILNGGTGSTFAELEEQLGSKGLDVRKGMVYCNGIEQYIKVLQGYCEDCDASGLLAEELFEKEDWKNYVIAVHGMKSAMRSIGAEQLSELARKLEYAGKEGRIEYIMEHHTRLMKEYQQFFTSLKEIAWIAPAEKQEKDLQPVSDEILRSLSKEEFGEVIVSMEDAAYSQEREVLLEQMAKLEEYQYCGHPLKVQLASVRRKIEMADYISAVETLTRLMDSMTNEVKK